MAADQTHAVMTFLQLVGERPVWPVNQRSIPISFFPSISQTTWWLLRVRWESSQTSSNRLASLLNGTWLAPAVTRAVATIFFLWMIAASGLPGRNPLHCSLLSNGRLPPPQEASPPLGRWAALHPPPQVRCSSGEPGDKAMFEVTTDSRVRHWPCPAGQLVNVTDNDLAFAVGLVTRDVFLPMPKSDLQWYSRW